jgi:hypothetical protein
MVLDYVVGEEVHKNDLKAKDVLIKKGGGAGGNIGEFMTLVTLRRICTCVL